MPLQIIRQDITKITADAIVNTTNREMVGLSGVDMAIHEAAGPELEAECRRLAPIQSGEAAVTGGYRLSCKYIIHTCGPIWQGGDMREKEQLEHCYKSGLMAALEHGCETVAFPLISAGVYGYPKDQVLKLAVNTITEFLTDYEMTVYLCVYDRKAYEFSKKLFFDIKDYLDEKYESDSRCLSASFADLARAPTDERIKPKFSSDARSQGERFSPRDAEIPFSSSVREDCLDDWLRKLDAGFSETLLAYIDARGMTDVECYKKANIDKKTFWKIKNSKGYKPSKQTAVAFAVALRLNLSETQHLLNTVGMSLSRSFKFDVIIEYFITKGNYNIFEINEALFEFDQPLLGC